MMSHLFLSKYSKILAIVSARDSVPITLSINSESQAVGRITNSHNEPPTELNQNTLQSQGHYTTNSEFKMLLDMTKR